MSTASLLPPVTSVAGTGATRLVLRRRGRSWHPHSRHSSPESTEQHPIAGGTFAHLVAGQRVDGRRSTGLPCLGAASVIFPPRRGRRAPGGFDAAVPRPRPAPAAPHRRGRRPRPRDGEIGWIAGRVSRGSRRERITTEASALEWAGWPCRIPGNVRLGSRRRRCDVRGRRRRASGRGVARCVRGCRRRGTRAASVGRG